MAKPSILPDGSALEPLSVEQLEMGLRVMRDRRHDRRAFWDENIAAYRETVVCAIRETSDSLLSPTITLRWRIELEGQLEELIQYLALADGYIARQALTPVPPPSEQPPARERRH